MDNADKLIANPLQSVIAPGKLTELSLTIWYMNNSLNLILVFMGVISQKEKLHANDKLICREKLGLQV